MVIDLPRPCIVKNSIMSVWIVSLGGNRQLMQAVFYPSRQSDPVFDLTIKEGE